MSAPSPVFTSPEEGRDGLAILANGRRPRRRRIVRAIVEAHAEAVAVEIVATDGPFAVARIPDGRLTIIGQLARRRAR